MNTETTVEVAHDTKLGELLAKLAEARQNVAQLQTAIAQISLPVVSYTGVASLPGDRPSYNELADLPAGTVYYQSKTFNRGDEGTWIKTETHRRYASFEADVLPVAEHIAEHETGAWADRVAKCLARYADAVAAVPLAVQAVEEHEKAYTGWTRYFLVVSSAGHVHNGLNCSTCYPTTVYSPVVSLSGKGDAEAIDLLGSTLCTVCFPEAPIEGKPKKVTKAQAKKLAAA